jgi:membrane protein involved in colicin uptake
MMKRQKSAESQEADQKAIEEAEAKSKAEADRKANEEADRKAKEDADLKAKEEADRLVKEEADRLAKEEADRKAKEEADRKAKEEADRKAKEAAQVLEKASVGQDRLSEYKIAFALLDKDGDGTITAKEFAGLLNSLGQSTSAADLEVCLSFSIFVLS